MTHVNSFYFSLMWYKAILLVSSDLHQAGPHNYMQLYCMISHDYWMDVNPNINVYLKTKNIFKRIVLIYFAHGLLRKLNRCFMLRSWYSKMIMIWWLLKRLVIFMTILLFGHDLSSICCPRFLGLARNHQCYLECYAWYNKKLEPTAKLIHSWSPMWFLKCTYVKKYLFQVFFFSFFFRISFKEMLIVGYDGFCFVMIF